MGTSCTLPEGTTLGRLGLHEAPLAERVSNLTTHEAVGQQVGCGTVFLARVSGSSCQSSSILPCRRRLCQPYARMCQIQKVAEVTLNWSLTKMDSVNPMLEAPSSPQQM